MEFKDYYQLLGVERSAKAEDIKKAFRRLARKFHPDVSKEKDAEARMKEVNEAYSVLSDPEKRAAYDRLGSGYRSGQEFRPPPDWDAGFEFSDQRAGMDDAEFSAFFSELFGRMGGAAGDGRARARRRTRDHHARVVLDIEDALAGATREIVLQVPKASADGGIELATHRLAVKIPKGIREGQVIRLAGQASPAGPTASEPPGDLLLEVAFRAHATLRVDGRDLHMNLPLAPWEAALGAMVPVSLPHASLQVRIPEGAQGGQQLRVRGKGVPCEPPGDLLLDIRIVVPPASSAKTRELYQSLARESNFDPRAVAT